MKKYINNGALYLYLLLFGFVRVSYGLTYIEPDLENPYPSDIVVPFARMFNALLLIAGAVLLAMIIYGAIKMSMALGKPNEFDGAKKTFTYAVMGFGIVIGFFALWRIITGAMGISSFSTPNQIFESMVSAIDDLLIQAKVFPSSATPTN